MAKTIEVVNCSFEEVQKAIDGSESGDFVLIPLGQASWNKGVLIDKEITVMGTIRGNDITTITCGDSPFESLINVTTTKFRISKIKLNGKYKTRGITVKFDAQKFRIDSCAFEACYSRAILIDGGWVSGFIYDNNFYNCGTSDIAIYADNDAAWQRPVLLGKAGDGKDVVFVEGNVFNYEEEDGAKFEHSIASNDGARYVFRYNKITCKVRTSKYHLAAAIDAHGNCHSGRGTVSIEVYGNTIEVNGFRGMYIRGGSGVIFNDTLIGNINYPIALTNYRSFVGGCKGNTSCEEYPCPDQINQLYIWDNILNGKAISATVDDEGLNASHIVKGRDYFESPKEGYEPVEYPHPDRSGSEIRSTSVNKSELKIKGIKIK